MDAQKPRIGVEKHKAYMKRIYKALSKISKDHHKKLNASTKKFLLKILLGTAIGAGVVTVAAAAAVTLMVGSVLWAMHEIISHK